jgi:NitT/TauT family transport system ATP-binding protein
MVQLADVSVRYGSHTILSGVDLDLSRPGNHVIMGPSGCGKSTLLKAIISASLRREEPGLPHYTGLISIPKKMRLSYVPQESGLAPWLTAKQNIELAQKLRHGELSASFDKDLQYLVQELSLDLWLSHTPRELSVGTARRVALARALASGAELLLLDEPFAGLDFDLRERAIALLRKWSSRSGTAFFMITHEPYEAAQTSANVHVLSREKGVSADASLHCGPTEPASGFQERIRAASAKATVHDA